jgi:HlyD family type I secretion membrane fusion protein
MSQLPSLDRRGRTDLITAPISAFESETQAVILRTSPYSQHAVLHVISAIIVLSLLLMCFVKLDRVVNSSGRILPTAGSYFVQPLDKAIVTAIVAHPGDVVRKGQVLARLDPTFAQADLKDLQAKASSEGALVARLKAEQAGTTYVVDPNSPDSVLQGSIFGQRRAEYLASVSDFSSRMASDEAVVSREHTDAADYAQRLALAQQAEQTQVELEKEGFGRKLSLLGATDARLEVQRMASESRAGASQAGSDAASLAAQRAAFISKWREDLTTQLVAAQTALDETNQALAKASKVSDLSTLVAPADSVVLKVGRASIGSIVDPTGVGGEPLFTLTPLGGPLQAEVRVEAKDIGFIKVGDTVRVKLDAYNYISHGLAKGVIKTISDNSFTTTDDGQLVPPFYKVIVAITDARLRNVPRDFQLFPGLTVSGDILVGRRTIMQYLLEGVMRTGSEAMREPE